MRIRAILVLLSAITMLVSLFFLKGNSYNIIFLLIEVVVCPFLFLVNIPFYFISTKNLKDGKFSLMRAETVTLLVKFLLIPFFVIGGFIVFVLPEMLIFQMGPFAFLVNAFGAFAGGCAIIASSSFSVPVINKLYYNNRITQLQRVINIILQFIFIVDIFSLIYIIYCGKIDTSNDGLASGKLSGSKTIQKTVNFRIIFLILTLYPILLMYVYGMPEIWEILIPQIIKVNVFLNVVAIIICVVFAFSLYKRIVQNRSQIVFMKKAALTIKLLLLPYFVINVLVWMSSLLYDIPTSIWTTMLLPSFRTIIIYIHCCLLLLASASFSLPTIILLVKEGRISKSVGVLSGIMQFFFVLDIASFIYIYMVSSKEPNALDGGSQIEQQIGHH